MALTTTFSLCSLAGHNVFAYSNAKREPEEASLCRIFLIQQHLSE